MTDSDNKQRNNTTVDEIENELKPDVLEKCQRLTPFISGDLNQHLFMHMYMSLRMKFETDIHLHVFSTFFSHGFNRYKCSATLALIT